MGGSWGGLLVTYALMERPDVFDGALAIGSSYNGAERSLQAQLNALAKAQPLNGKRFYLGMGKLDPAAPGGVEYYEALKKLILKACSIGWIFRGLWAFGYEYSRLCRWAAVLFARPSLNLPPQSLQNLPGFTHRLPGRGRF